MVAAFSHSVFVLSKIQAYVKEPFLTVAYSLVFDDSFPSPTLSVDLMTSGGDLAWIYVSNDKNEMSLVSLWLCFSSGFSNTCLLGQTHCVKNSVQFKADELFISEIFF
jgi:hypothetical protein